MNTITPGYVGFDYGRNVTWKERSDLFWWKNKTVEMGGFMEPHGYGSEAPDRIDWISSAASEDFSRPSGVYSSSDSHSTSDSPKEGYATITKDAPHPFTLQRAIAHSSFAPGAWVHEESPVFGKAVMDYMNYWSPNTKNAEDNSNNNINNDVFLIADGGCTDNLNVMASIRRGVDRLILWDNPGTPLQTKEAFDPYARSPRSDDVSPDLMPFFGYHWVVRGQSTRHNQIFSKADFPRVVAGLQAAQASGASAVRTFNLTTIENEYFGIPAGRQLLVTFYHAGRVFEWEKQLPYATRQLVTPDTGNVTDPTNLVRGGIFANFPFFNTFLQLDLTAEQVNLLSHMSTWIVERNRDHFDLSRTPVVDNEGQVVGWVPKKDGDYNLNLIGDSENFGFKTEDDKSIYV